MDRLRRIGERLRRLGARIIVPRSRLRVRQFPTTGEHDLLGTPTGQPPRTRTERATASAERVAQHSRANLRVIRGGAYPKPVGRRRSEPDASG